MDQLFHGEEAQKNYREKMPPEEKVCLQLAKGLAYIHENRSIHRDLKPENVLIWVDSTGEKVLMKWADFEQCVPVDENGCYTIIDVSEVGTPDWNAPELVQIQKDGNETAPGTVKSDVFSQGLVFGYYILRGRHPYPEENIMQYILDSKPKNLKGICTHFKNII
jgi:serine/threonine protein kinase